MKAQTTKQLILASLFTAMGVLLPIAFHAFGMGGPVFLPMHIPVLLCGFICGYRLGGIVGMLTPLLSSFLTGMPVLYPMGVYMVFELATYGLVCGLLSRKYKPIPTLLVAMVCGRAVSALARLVMFSFGLGSPLVVNAFLTSSFVTALPGIVIQIIFVPLVLMSIKQAYKGTLHFTS